ncbi:hypothetical protein SMD44_p10005 (plasmid) [Streptomyces alboflavus]|uniref:Uncharacterized protein n=1 Tax=Streptomyces alboflavus TaxID=67267 RepID=A0A291W3C8_9ACTN|nr:hypothetical protein [Streptomyces alboflavus]ATM24504.1 hypothetical protein SMD44_p10005 [Streptomyces alboflavus]
MKFEFTEPKFLPLEANGHILSFLGKLEVEVYSIAGAPKVLGVANRCGFCDERPVYRVTDKTIKVESPCPYPDGLTTEITLKVPSGKVIVTDDLRSVYSCDDSGFASYNSALGQAQVVHAMAAVGCAYGPVGNSCPGLYRTGPDTYIIARPGYDEDDTPDPAFSRYDFLAGITTDLWAYSIADFEHWKSRGGDPDKLGWDVSVVDITPGTYRFTHHSGEHDFNPDVPGTVTFAHVERID